MSGQLKKVIVILSSAALLFGSIFVYFNLLQPVYDEVNRASNELSNKQALLENIKIVVKQLKQKVDALETSGDADKIAQVITTSPKLSELLNQMQGIAAQKNVFIVSFTPVFTAPVQQLQLSSRLLLPLKTISLVVRFNGSYAGIKEFVRALETNIRLLDIKSVSISGSKTGEDRYGVDMKVNAYYQ